MSVNSFVVVVADPGYPDGGTNQRGEGANLLFGKFFKENCMKIKEIGPREVGAHFPRVPRDPPMNIVPCYNR